MSLFKKVVPNCATCKWIKLKSFFFDYDRCKAQANQIAENVYNNRLCNKLYQENKEVNNE